MSRNVVALAVALGAVSLCGGAAQAEDNAIPGSLSANIAFTNDYVFRGFSQTDEHAAVQGGIDYSHDSGLYAGIWGSNVDFDDGDEAALEMDVYAGYSGSYSGITYDVGGIYYGYPGADDSLNYDFFELKVAVGYDFGMAAVTASANWSPDYFAGSGDSWYPALNVDVPLPADFAFNAHYGYQFVQNNAAFGVEDYHNWGVAVSREFPELWGLNISVGYEDTSVSGNLSDPRFVISGSKSF